MLADPHSHEESLDDELSEVKMSKAQDMWISEKNSKVGPLAWKWQ